MVKASCLIPLRTRRRAFNRHLFKPPLLKISFLAGVLYTHTTDSGSDGRHLKVVSGKGGGGGGGDKAEEDYAAEDTQINLLPSLLHGK